MAEDEKDPRTVVLEMNQRLLDAIAGGDYDTYDRSCIEDMTCIEPESKGMVVEGKDFHRYYFDLAASRQTTLNNDSDDRPGPPSIPTNVTMSQPHVRLIANDTVAIISCIRLNQTGTCTTQISETRVWELRDGEWKHVHFHKS